MKAWLQLEKLGIFVFINLEANVLERWNFDLSTGEKMLEGKKLQGWRGWMEIYGVQVMPFKNKALQGNIRFRLQPVSG